MCGSYGVKSFPSAAERFRADGRVVFAPSGVFASLIDAFAPFGVPKTDGGWGGSGTAENNRLDDPDQLTVIVPFICWGWYSQWNS